MSSTSMTRRWSIVAMLFLFMLINYADKAVIGLASVPIMDELQLTNTQFGTIGSAFFLLFSVSGVVGGFLSTRVSSKALLLGMALLWTVAQAPMIGTVSFTTLIAMRILLGAGEGPAFPLTLHAAYKWFDDRHRTLPTSIIASGAAFGTGVIAPGVTAIILHLGWHAAFAVLSGASLLWALCWAIWGAEGKVDIVAAPALAARHIPYRRLILSRTAIGVFVGGFAAYWALTLNVVWLAAYLVKGAGFTLAQAGAIIVLPSATQIVLALSLGSWADRRVRAGVSSRLARGIAGGICLVAAGGAMMLMPLIANPVLKIPLIALAFSAGSVFFTLGSPLIAEIAPPRQRGALLGITNSIHALAGLIAPIAMGWVVDVGADPVAGFRTGLIAAGAFVVVGGCIAMLLIDPQADLRSWGAPDDAEPAR